MEVEHIIPYCCVRCGGPLLTTDAITFTCDSCSRFYPVVSDIPIFTLRPSALLRASVQALRTADSKIHELSALSATDAGRDPSHSAFQVRADQALTGMRANLALAETYTRPVQYLLSEKEKEADPDFIDAISNCGAGWSLDWMLPYFYQDWGGTNDFFNLKSLILTALRRHRVDSKAIALLGAGACGLVQATAADFEVAYGIDLSLPTLLIARGVLSGDYIAVHLESAGWRPTEIHSSEAVRPNIRLAVADVANLPFADGRMSAVVTQYLMDIVDDPYQIAIEIQRVLKPGGVWLNFSLPFRIPVEPIEFGRISVQEMSVFLQSAGLHLLDCHLERFTLLNLEKITSDANLCQSSVHFFIARKPSATPGSPNAIAHNGAYRQNDDRWWQAIPKFMPGRTVQVAYMTDFSAKGQAKGCELSFSQHPLVGLALQRFSVREGDASRLRVVLELIDGKRTNQEIYDRFVAEAGPIKATDFWELLYYLSDRHGCVRVTSASHSSSGPP